MNKARFITAIGTPLTENEDLHDESLEMHLADQWNHGITDILVAGTMGAMQLLTDETYRRLTERCVALWSDKGDVLVGAGDAGFTRTKERILYLNTLSISGIAVLSPYFWKFGQKELIDYYSALAEVSKAPLYLYDLPQVIGTKLEMDTFLKLAKHPNIAGAKVSCDFDFSRQLIDASTNGFRIIVAQPSLVDLLLRHGVREHLDGIWAMAPGWTVALGKAAEAGDWEKAADYQQRLTAVRKMLTKYGFSVFTAIMNARGIPGRFAPRPFLPLTAAQHETLLADPTIQALITEDPAMP